MSEPRPRRRRHPSDRFAGAEHALELPAALRALRGEPSSGSGHRQITLLHHGPVRLVLFAFDEGGRMPDHRAPGWITIHVMRGSLLVRTPAARHELGEGELLALAPGIEHDVEATAESDMLLGIYPEAPVGSKASSL